MKLEDFDLDFMPTNSTFVKLVESEEIRLEFYKPTFLEMDVPFERAWWKIMYWLPREKRKLYTANLIAGEPAVADILYKQWGIDPVFFKRHYGFFLKRLKWMRTQNKANHLGEL